jgi:hypothetical protein
MLVDARANHRLLAATLTMPIRPQAVRVFPSRSTIGWSTGLEKSDHFDGRRFANSSRESAPPLTAVLRMLREARTPSFARLPGEPAGGRFGRSLAGVIRIYSGRDRVNPILMVKTSQDRPCGNTIRAGKLMAGRPYFDDRWRVRNSRAEL